MNAPNFVIESREHLVNLLAEAAEIEHNLMCCYLYAAFSLKDSTDEDLSETELAAVKSWRREIIHVAVEEMTHLALVANITSALGGIPHFGRPNFPVAAGYHPAGIVVKLAPFNYETLQHFIYLERPDEAPIKDGDGFEPTQHYFRVAPPDRLMPNSQDYDTVGTLYRAIRIGLEQLVARHGEAALFIGDPLHQLGPELANLPGLTRVRCLKTACEALHGIVVQGEGAAAQSTTSHYQRFLHIRAEFEQLRTARANFIPARPAAHNPVMRHPMVSEGRVWIQQRPAADLVDLVNAIYNLMLRLLTQAYAETRGVSAQVPLVDAAIDLMMAISPVASALTRLPANTEHPDCTAGMSFAMNRLMSALPAGSLPDRILLERLREIVAVAVPLLQSLPALAKVAAQLSKICTRLEEGLMHTTPPNSASDAAQANNASSTMSPTTHAVPASTINNGVESVPGKSLTLHFEGKRCIHARHCVLGLPKVFKANVEGPWLDPDANSVEELITVAHMCPSGAITYTRTDGGADEVAPPVNLVQLRENGPLGVRAELRIDGVASGYRATLCRCGASQRKPFCDGSHTTIGFIASGEPATRTSEPLANRNGVLDIRPQQNGPLVVRGNLEICAGTGRTVDRVTETRLCRCGASENKPFCDGSHARVGFVAD